MILSEETLDLYIKTKLHVQQFPIYSERAELAWSSSNNDIVVVSADGIITATGVGTATIIAKTADGKLTATCTITVNAPIVRPTGVTLDKTFLELQYKQKNTVKLNATILPEEVKDALTKWTTSDSSIATVDENGNVKANKSGTATITATVVDKDGNAVKDANGKDITATCTVTVKLVWWQWIIKILLFGWIWY